MAITTDPTEPFDMTEPMENIGVVTDWCEVSDWKTPDQPRFLFGNKTIAPVFGDRIEIHGALGYQHWGIYFGKNKLCNFAGVDKPTGKIEPDKLTDPLNNMQVFFSELSLIIGKSKARINNEDDIQDDFTPATRDTVMKRIEKFMDTRPITNKCEHFTNYCRYEKHVSNQKAVEAFGFLVKAML
ncbi:phospholipase A and acyltransferase 4-like [Amphiura filiformis]|uniref:phospholipase A and acyltransferase 4-like n=1 Tax=Amphiura filiformis TaxID=82378 RepID=UPI003B21E77E